jgi:8-amino-7-oxononanoate synthase
MTPASTATVLAALDILQNEPERLEHLWDLSIYALEQFKSKGFDTGKTESPIIPLFIRDNKKALMLTQILFENGVFVNPVVSPAVPKNSSLIRFSLTAAHSFEQVDRAIEKITLFSKKIGVL